MKRTHTAIKALVDGTNAVIDGIKTLVEAFGD